MAIDLFIGLFAESALAPSVQHDCRREQADAARDRRSYPDGRAYHDGAGCERVREGSINFENQNIHGYVDVSLSDGDI